MKQIKNLVYTLLLSVLGATMFTACSEEEDVVDAKDLVLSKEELLFFAEPGEYQEVTFTANADWKATSEQGWILIDTPVGKKGESTVSISVKENTEKVARQGSVIISEPSTGKMASFKVKQEAQGVKFIVSPENGEFVIDDENQIISQKINVKANFDYDIRIVDTEWVTYSVGEDGEIVFNADIMQPLPTEPKDVKIEFVPTEEGAETKSVTIKWNGYTPYVKFYREIQPEAGSQSQEVTYEEITGNVEFDKMGSNTVTYVESNVPWTFSKEGVDFTSLISYNGSEDMTKAKELPYAVKTKAALFVNYDKAKLTNEDEALTLSFSFGEETKTLTFSKKGYNIYFDESQFRTLIDINDENPSKVPTFPAVPTIVDEKQEGLSLEFEVLAAYEVEPIIFKKETENKSWSYVPSKMAGAECEPIGTEDYNTILKKYKYRLSVNDRSSNGNEGDKMEFKLYLAKKVTSSLGPLFYEYFDDNDLNSEQLQPTKNIENITSGLDFAQLGYTKLYYSFESTDITKDGKDYEVSVDGGVINLNYESSNLDMNLVFFTNAEISEDGNYILYGIKDSDNPEQGEYTSKLIDFWKVSESTGNMITEFFDMDSPEFPPLKVNVNPKNEATLEEITIYFGGQIDNKTFQYFGEFTIKYEQESSPTPEQ